MRSDLILVPTHMEMQVLRPLLLSSGLVQDNQLSLCGFGPIAAAARTAQLLAHQRPDRVLLVGIAGRLTDRLLPGSAYCFRRVACCGVGAGTGPGHQSADRLGWSQWPGDVSAPARPADPAGLPIGDLIELADITSDAVPVTSTLLTVCSASGCPEDAAWRVEQYPEVVAEDMEGYGVAMACHLAGVPLQIVRGISNTAGDRQIHRWKISESLQAASAVVIRLLQSQNEP